MTARHVSQTVDEIFSALQQLAEAGLCLTALGICYGVNELFYYWPLLQNRLA